MSRSKIGRGPVEKKSVQRRRLKNHMKNDKKQGRLFPKESSCQLPWLGMTRRIFLSLRKKRGRESWVKLAGAKIMLKKRRGCWERMVSILVLMLDFPQNNTLHIVVQRYSHFLILKDLVATCSQWFKTWQKLLGVDHTLLWCGKNIKKNSYCRNCFWWLTCFVEVIFWTKIYFFNFKYCELIAFLLGIV